MLTTFSSYQQITRDIGRSLARTAASPTVALEGKYYLATIGKVKSIDDFLKNDRVFRYAMKAFGLEDMSYAKAYIRKVLVEGVEDSKSFANRLADDRFIDFAKTFNFARDGAAVTTADSAKQGVVDKYVRQTMESSAGEENEGVRLALYFQRMAPTVSSAYGLLADAALWKVVQTVFDFPAEMANADITRQAAAVKARLDVKTLKEPAALNRLIQRFTARWDTSDPAASASPALSLLSQQPGIGLDLVMTLHNLKRGGN